MSTESQAMCELSKRCVSAILTTRLTLDLSPDFVNFTDFRQKSTITKILGRTTCDEIKILQKAQADWHREQAQQQEALAQECRAKLPALKAEAVTLRNELVKLKKEDELANKRDGLQPRTLSTTMLERRKSNRKSKKK